MLSILLKFAKTTSIEAQILREGAGVALQKKCVCVRACVCKLKSWRSVNRTA